MQLRFRIKWCNTFIYSPTYSTYAAEQCPCSSEIDSWPFRRTLWSESSQRAGHFIFIWNGSYYFRKSVDRIRCWCFSVPHTRLNLRSTSVLIPRCSGSIALLRSCRDSAFHKTIQYLTSWFLSVLSVLNTVVIMLIMTLCNARKSWLHK